MKWQRTNVDASLLSFLEATHGSDADELLSKLISEHATQTIRSIVRSKLRVTLDPGDGGHENQEAMEIVAETQASLIEELQRRKLDAPAKEIHDFKAYVAVATYHACYRYLRRKYPERWRLKNKLRYLLSHRPGFVVWKDEGQEWLCGFTAARNQKRIPRLEFIVQEIKETYPQPTTQPGHGLQPDTLTELVTAIFQAAGGPTSLDELVNVVADLWLPKHETTGPVREDREEDRSERLSDQSVNVATAVEQRIYLQELWQQICQLPVRHRTALLLNLRDARGRGVISLLPLTGIASMRQIAEVLDFPLLSFARVWNELPWEDSAIAAHLGLNRQQVINLRHSARARLARRLKAF